MFGFLRPRAQSLLYRSFYSRLCQHQRNFYGLSSLVCLNYEAVFLYAIAYDLQRLDDHSIRRQHCCRLRKDNSLREAEDSEIGLFLSSAGLLAASIKLEDDLADNNGLVSGLIKKLLHKKFERVRRYFNNLDPVFERRIGDIVQSQGSIEKSARTELSEFCKPTVEAFGYIFQLFSRLSDIFEQERLGRLAQHIGRAIILYDQAIDFHHDKKMGNYSIVSSASEIESFLKMAAGEVLAARDLCRTWLGEKSLSASILNDVGLRIAGVRDCERGRKRLDPTNVPTLAARLSTVVGALLAPSRAWAGSAEDGAAVVGICCFCLGLSACCTFAERKVCGTYLCQKED